MTANLSEDGGQIYATLPWYVIALLVLILSTSIRTKDVSGYILGLQDLFFREKTQR